MALRRVLPSRSAPDKTPESAVAPVAKPKDIPAPKPVESAPEVSVPVAPAWDASAIAAAASAFSDLPTPKAETRPESQPEPVPAAPEPAFSAPAWDAPAAIAQEMPATEPVEVSAPVRSLEDSFAKPAQVLPEADAATFVAPAWDAPSSDTFVAPAWDAPAEPASVPVVAEAAAEPAPVVETPVAEVSVEVPAVAAAPMPQAEPVSPFLPEPEPAAVSTPSVEEPKLQDVQSQPETVSEPVAVAQTQSTEEAVPQGPTTFDFQPSRPDNAQIKRRVREKRPRDLSAIGSAPDAQVERPKPMTAFAPAVPVDTKPLDQVDESLIASGVLAPRPADSLTGGLPVGLAESESPAPQFQSTSFAEPAPVVPVQPAAPAVPEIAPVPEFVAQPEPQLAAPAPVLPEPLPVPAPAAPVTEPVSLAIPTLPSEPAHQPTSYTLSSTPTVQAPATTPLSQTQSDLPWTQPQSSAEWDIGAPETAAWGSGMVEEAAPASHMPPPASDLYKPISAQPGLPQPPSLPPRTMATFTPELPGQKAKSNGVPWAFVAVGALVVIGAGAYFMGAGGSGRAQQQLANITNPQPQQAAGTDGLLPPPVANGEGSSFFAAVPPASSVSSNAVVNFADVPADQVNQPIVATGTEEMPEDMSLGAQFMSEVSKARARKEGQPVDPSATATAPETAATGESPDQLRAKLQEEMAAYRSALAQSSSPADLKPANFRANPQNRMEGTAAPAETAQAAEGSLLPPPTTTAGGATPPAELYTNNPKNLPVVAEPLANAPSRVRTLADFPDIEPYMPEREKVEIPKNLKPKMAATDFPALEVLSFVPGKGIVAFADGREGVLLIGESLNGWELVGVSADNAEFKAGQKNHQVTAEN
ncbi:MAG: hypothetical protein DI585_04210 [Pseudomonas fluorescens]|nr:MAG: hypothetical protein DI585_04210 [Pseudomonas fluorescens]